VKKPLVAGIPTHMHAPLMKGKSGVAKQYKSEQLAGVHHRLTTLLCSRFCGPPSASVLY
jgi:hypothetical protein